MALWAQTCLNYFRQRDRAWLLSLLAAVCLVYLPFLGNPFFFMDVPFFTTGVARQYAHSLFQFDLRWLPYASLGWTAAIFGESVALLFHLGNTLLHAANVEGGVNSRLKELVHRHRGLPQDRKQVLVAEHLAGKKGGKPPRNVT